MPFSSFMIHVRTAFSGIQWEHLLVMGIIAVAVSVWGRLIKKYSMRGAVALGFVILLGLFLIDALVLKRIGVQVERHPEFDLTAEYNRLFYSDKEHRFFMLFNIAAFIPFGLVLSGFLSETHRFSFKRIVALVALITLMFSFCIECTQWILRVGLFELSDVILNTLGALIGSAITYGGISVTKSYVR